MKEKTIIWKSSDEGILKVDDEGNISAVSPGYATITASYEGDGNYASSFASCQVKVRGNAGLSFSSDNVSIVKGEDLTPPVLHVEAGDGRISYHSSNPEVATVDEENGTVAIKGVGITRITATAEETDLYHSASATYTLVINAQKDSSVTAFDFASWTIDDGLTSKEFTSTEKNNVLIIAEKNTVGLVPSWYKSDKTLHVYSNNTMSISSNYRIKQIQFQWKCKNESVKNDNVSFSCGSYKEKKQILDLSGSDIKNVTMTFRSTIYIEKIIVTSEAPDGTIVIATDEGYGTYYTTSAYVMPDGLIGFGYISANTAEGALVKSLEYQEGDVVPAETPLVVKGSKGKHDFQFTTLKPTKIIDGNLLKGVTEKTDIEASENVSRYILTYGTINDVLGFFMTEDGGITVQANRAYLELQGPAAVLGFCFEDNATAIVGVQHNSNKSLEIYTLGGVRIGKQRVEELPSGTYICNGRLIIK